MRLNSGRWKVKRGYEMRPRRYPYSGKKESTFVKADPELVLNINKINTGNIQAKNIFGKILDKESR